MNTMGIYIPIVIMINIATYYYEIFSRIYSVKREKWKKVWIVFYYLTMPGYVYLFKSKVINTIIKELWGNNMKERS